MKAILRYLDHSGFSVETGSALLVFDYYNNQAERPEPDCGVINGRALVGYDRVAVFVSHSHGDHFNPVIYEWSASRLKTDYFLSFEIPEQYAGIRMSPGDVKASGDMTVRAYGSTDIGVSFLVEIDGLRIFHAGDLNWWHWRDEEDTTSAWLAEAEALFYKEMEPIIEEAKRKPFDIAFFPVDPRLKTLFDAGANYFIHSVKPRVFVPMHTWGADELVLSFARKTKQRGVTIVPITERGGTYTYEKEDVPCLSE